MPLAVLLLLVQSANALPTVVARCEVVKDPSARVYELRASPDRSRWALLMHSRKAGNAPVWLPLPDARPAVSATSLTLDYRTLNGGREVHWRIAESDATLDVHANFELEVNVEADLDPRVELMNTEGAVGTLSCAMNP